jgi:hypothetical protein
MTRPITTDTVADWWRYADRAELAAMTDDELRAQVAELVADENGGGAATAEEMDALVDASRRYVAWLLGLVYTA